MNAPITKPWEKQYTVEDTEILAETPDLRAVRITLAAGEEIPLHFHTDISDRIICIEGEITVGTKGPDETHRLAPGAECLVPPKTAHVVRNTAAAGHSRFIVIQGIGAYDYVAVGRQAQ